MEARLSLRCMDGLSRGVGLCEREGWLIELLGTVVRGEVGGDPEDKRKEREKETEIRRVRDSTGWERVREERGERRGEEERERKKERREEEEKKSGCNWPRTRGSRSPRAEVDVDSISFYLIY